MYKMIERAKNKKNRKGFTLIELIVVIVIIGILAAIIIPRLSGFSDTAQDKANLATARTVYSAVAVAVAMDDAAVDPTDITDLLGADLLESDPSDVVTGIALNPIVITYLLSDGSTEATYPEP